MRALEVNLGVELPTAYSGLRRVLDALREISGKAVAELKSRPEVWNHLYPAERIAGGNLLEVAISPSERRLHRESEQVFRVLTLAAKAIRVGLEEAGRSLVLHDVGAADLVSLRGIMRAIEWGRLDAKPPAIELRGWNSQSAIASQRFAARRARFLQSLRERMRVGLDSAPARTVRTPGIELGDEARYLRAALAHDAPARRLAACVLAIRECFFTTNYDGAMIAIETGFELLAKHGGELRIAEVQAAWDELDSKLVTAAIEVDRSCLEDLEHLRALFHRCEGVVRSFCGENDDAMAAFGAGLSCPIRPERIGQLRMFRALSLIKRMGQTEVARGEGRAGLAAVEGSKGEDQALHEAWLRNVVALTYFQDKNLTAARVEEMIAIKCLAGLRSASATHLKINLITNLSVLLQTENRMPEAIAAWRKFENTIDHWDDNFHKHHRYRLAALYRSAGDVELAEKAYRAAYAGAEKLADWFSLQVIATDLGLWKLERNEHGAAVEWFAKAFQHAIDFGDPLRAAESLAGQALAQKQPVPAEALRLAAMSSTYPDDAKKLTAAIQSGDAAAIRAAFPKLRSKLNRPFDVVNLY